MSSSSPTDIVLIPGGWHTPSSYRKFTTALSAAFPSLRVTVLPLPSITNDPSPTADYYTDSSFVRSSVSSMIAESRRLAVLMHSYGGHVGSNALHGLYHHHQSPTNDGEEKGGITHLIYLAAALLFPNTLMSVPYGDSRPNVSLVNMDDFGFLPDGKVVALRPVEMWIGSVDSEEDNLKGEATGEEIEEYVSTIIPISARVFNQKSVEAAWMEGMKIKKEGEDGNEVKGPEVVYVMCTKDMSVPYDLQEWMVGRAREEVGVDVKVRRLETGHVPMLTKTGELVKILEEVLGE